MSRKRYLLAAEADKIQDYLFRASMLREVVGGSALLARFCQEAPRDCLGMQESDVVINRGGGFRLLFDSREEAEAGGRLLADLYAMATGGQMTVAEPVEWDGNPERFRAANQATGRKLRVAKRAAGPAASAHLPQVAFCNSTGVELAARYVPPRPGEDPRYVSAATLIKTRERDARGYRWLREIFASVDDPGELDWPWEAGQVGRYDPRDYVAYLLADGNGMGALFDQCASPEALRQLSTLLDQVVRSSLAEATRKLVAALAPRDDEEGAAQRREKLVPVLPLIQGGDDLFVLLPAPWALSFAQAFCREFEAQMAEELAAIPELAGARPTMATAVVICKSKYPFGLAHARGEALLQEAKWLGKRARPAHSTVTFEVITGNRLAAEGDDRQARPSLRPYWVLPASPDRTRAGPADSLALDKLLDFRLELARLPQKRRAQMRTFFEPASYPKGDQAGLRRWREELEALVQRIGKLEGEPLQRTIAQALTGLGGGAPGAYWRTVTRGGQELSATAFVDVLDAWDFLLDLERDPRSYRE